MQHELGRDFETEGETPSASPRPPKGYMAEYNHEQAKIDTILVLTNLIEQLRKVHGVPSKSDARAIIREAMMEL
jgi:hypothetical protein